MLKNARIFSYRVAINTDNIKVSLCSLTEFQENAMESFRNIRFANKDVRSNRRFKTFVESSQGQLPFTLKKL